MEILVLPVEEKTLQQTTVKSQTTIPIYLYATVLASVSIMVGLIWDISWHTSIGRDGLLSPPHLAIYFGGILAGVFSGIRVLKVSFWGNEQEKHESIRFWGVFRGSLGALFCIWGAFAMLTSAPFDDWWHNTYGLDVTILSPPHTILLLGMITIQFGAIITVLSVKNRMERIDTISVDATTRKKLRFFFALSSGFLLSMVFTIASEYLGRHDMHKSSFYIVACLVFPLLLVAFSRAAPGKWGASYAALVYSLFMAMMVWILPLFPAEPLLGPVLNPIANFQAFDFPLLLIIPALGIDLITQKMGNQNPWLISLIYATVFLITMIVFQWPFGDFLMSEFARNWFFGTESWYFGSRPDWEYRYAYSEGMISTGMELVRGLAVALSLGYLTSRLSIKWGHWMKSVLR